MNDQTTIPPGTAEATEDADHKVVLLRQVARTGEKREQVAQQAEVFLNAFRALHEKLKAAATGFREAIHVEAKECRDVIAALQALRRETAACLDFLKAERCHIFAPLYAHGLSPMVPLYRLDGEQTARLILTLDAFKSLLLSQKEKTTERINTHVRLQNDLAHEVKDLAELIGKLEEMITNVREDSRQKGGTHG